jgi:hypothetical protein
MNFLREGDQRRLKAIGRNVDPDNIVGGSGCARLLSMRAVRRARQPARDTVKHGMADAHPERKARGEHSRQSPENSPRVEQKLSSTNRGNSFAFTWKCDAVVDGAVAMYCGLLNRFNSFTSNWMSGWMVKISKSSATDCRAFVTAPQTDSVKVPLKRKSARFRFGAGARIVMAIEHSKRTSSSSDFRELLP